MQIVFWLFLGLRITVIKEGISNEGYVDCYILVF